MSTRLTAIIQREGDGFVSLCPELDIASQGATIEEARDNLHTALDLISKTPHVRPIIYTDKELQFVPDSDAPGITAYRQRLAAMLNNQPVQTIPHEEIIHRLDEAARTFNVLIIKTTLALPYTSVFLQLAAAYWSDDAESRLRQSMSGR